jgi:hypothetical protein
MHDCLDHARLPVREARHTHRLKKGDTLATEQAQVRTHPGAREREKTGVGSGAAGHRGLHGRDGP